MPEPKKKRSPYPVEIVENNGIAIEAIIVGGEKYVTTQGAMDYLGITRYAWDLTVKQLVPGRRFLGTGKKAIYMSIADLDEVRKKLDEGILIRDSTEQL